MFGRKRKLAKEKEEKERIENYQNAREKQTEIGQRFWKVVDLYPEVEKSCYFKSHLQNRYYNSWEVPVLDECEAVDIMQEKLNNYNEFIRKLIGQLKAYQGMIDQNKSDFKKFVENPTAFFVIEPLSSVLDSRCEIEYCFAVEFLDASDDFIDVLGFNAKTSDEQRFTIASNDYYIRPMNKEEFDKYYLPKRCSSLMTNNVWTENEAIAYVNDLKDLWRITMES